MGRRKIEIKAIKDDRNRSVTFLKRKGGLFKKAHELSVLCSVDVAVIIFGHNKKLYEFSSGDIHETIGRYQYYGQPHEHKGPEDYRGKHGGDSDEEEEDVSPPHDEIPQHPLPHPPPQPQSQLQQYPPHMPPQHPYPPQMRHPAASASPPIPQHMTFQRHGTPQPAPGSRPSSRNDIRRVSSNVVPVQPPHATPPPSQQNGFAYIPNPVMYQPPNQNMSRPLPGHPTPPPQTYTYPHQQPSQHYQPPSQHIQPPPPPQQHQPHQLHQAHHTFVEEQRRQSMPPMSEPQQQPHLQPPPHQKVRRTPEPEQRSPEIKTDQDESPPRPRALSSKSRSIFTPIDDRGSVLAQHFGFMDTREEAKPGRPSTTEPGLKAKPPSPPRAITPAHRTQSMPMPDIIPPSRTGTSNSKAGGPRPRLKVQIPSEASDAESATEGSSPRQSGATDSTPAKGSSSSRHSSGVVLPPPSPSASAILSAGATGPPNPFARPPPRDANVQNHTAYSGNNNIETPISALPSRFVADNLLPSPSSFYPDWGFGRSGPDSNMLPSPLTFPTPIKEVGTGFGREKDGEAGSGEKRKGSTEAGGEMKKLKT